MPLCQHQSTHVRIYREKRPSPSRNPSQKPVTPDRVVCKYNELRTAISVARRLYTAFSCTMMSTNNLQLNGLKGNTFNSWVECDGMALPIYGTETSADQHSIVGWIPVEQGKVSKSVPHNAHPLIAPFMQPFVVHWYRVKPAPTSKHKPCDMSAELVVDGRRLPYERHMLAAEKFWQSEFKFEGFESDSGKFYHEFIFSKLELTGMSTILISDRHAGTCVSH